MGILVEPQRRDGRDEGLGCCAGVRREFEARRSASAKDPALAALESRATSEARRGSSRQVGLGDENEVILPNDLEAAGFAERGDEVGVDFADVGLQVALRDGFEEALDFVGGAAGFEFDAAVGEIAHPADDFVAAGDAFDGGAESDALDASFVVNVASGHGSVGFLAAEKVGGDFGEDAVDVATARQFEGAAGMQPRNDRDVPSKIFIERRVFR